VESEEGCGQLADCDGRNGRSLEGSPPASGACSATAAIEFGLAAARRASSDLRTAAALFASSTECFKESAAVKETRKARGG
jgi:hypothetical protein